MIFKLCTKQTYRGILSTLKLRYNFCHKMAIIEAFFNTHWFVSQFLEWKHDL